MFRADAFLAPGFIKISEPFVPESFCKFTGSRFTVQGWEEKQN